MVEDLEIDKFEAELLTIFEKKKFLLTKYTEDGFCIQGEGLAETRIKIDEFFKLYKQGKSAEEIAQMMVTGNQRKVSEKPPIDNIYPMIKDRYFAAGYPTALKQAAQKAGVEWDQGYVPVMFKNWPDREIYIFSGIQTPQGYRYLNNKDYERFGMQDKQYMAAIMENLYRKIDGFMKEGRVKITKQDDGVFSFGMEEDMAASFLFIANRYFDFLLSAIGNPSAEFVYAFTVTTEEIILCDPKISTDKIKGIMTKIVEKQKAMISSVHHPVSIDAMIITRNGITFPQKATA